MKKTSALLLVLLLVMSLLLPGLSRAEEGITFTGTVNSASLHMRKTPAANGKVLNSYKKGTQVEILENDGTWCKVQVGKRTGYMMAAYLEIKPNYEHLGWGQTQDDGTVLNVRAEASPTGQILYKGISGGVFEVTGESGEWYKVRVGEQFGYLEKRRVTLRQGDYSLGFSKQDTAGAVTAASLFSALHEVGSAVSMSRTEGDFTYEVTYPATGVDAADQRISQWVREELRLFEADFQQNHAGVRGSCEVEYQSLQVSRKYQSVVLIAEYRVGTLKAEAMLAVNIDAEEEAVLEPETLLAKDMPWARFCLESGISSLMSTPTDGYTGKPESDWFKYAALGRDELQVYLPAGLYLPASLGSRRVDIKYRQIVDCLAMDADFLSPFVRTIDPTQPMIALTFDDGPSEETDKILAVLAEYNGRATFCVIGNKLETYSDVLKRTIAQGHEIASHTWSHPKLTTLSLASVRSQLKKTNDAVKDLTGYEIRVLRPPYGAVNKNVRTACAENGMIIAQWQVDTLDWKNRNTTKTYRAIMKGAKNGTIVLMHDLYSTTAAAVERAVPELVAKGYQLVTVSELLSFHKDGVKPGTAYGNLDPKNIKTE